MPPIQSPALSISGSGYYSFPPPPLSGLAGGRSAESVYLPFLIVSASLLGTGDMPGPTCTVMSYLPSALLSHPVFLLLPATVPYCKISLFFFFMSKRLNLNKKNSNNAIKIEVLAREKGHIITK